MPTLDAAVLDLPGDDLTTLTAVLWSRRAAALARPVPVDEQRLARLLHARLRRHEARATVPSGA